MRAVLCKSYGPPESLVVEDVPSRPLKDGEARVRVEACGVNFPDTLIIEGKYQFKPPMPFSPGGEIAGVVTEVAPGVDGVAVGDTVIGMIGWGGFAEEAVVSADRLLHRPAEMDVVTAAGFGMTYGTSMHALKQRAQLRAGETLVVLGAGGGVGLAAVEIGKIMGARVIAAASTAEKLETARAHGADETINYAEESLKDRIKELTDGRGADVIYDPVGGDFTEQALRATNWNGRLLIIGFASGPIPKLPANLPLLKGCSIVGVFWGSFRQREPELEAENFGELFQWYLDGRIKPHVSATYPLEEASQALHDLMERRAVGKIVLKP